MRRGDAARCGAIGSSSRGPIGAGAEACFTRGDKQGPAAHFSISAISRSSVTTCVRSSRAIPGLRPGVRRCSCTRASSARFFFNSRSWSVSAGLRSPSNSLSGAYSLASNLGILFSSRRGWVRSCSAMKGVCSRRLRSRISRNARIGRRHQERFPIGAGSALSIWGRAD
jgi:hypothetical protein